MKKAFPIILALALLGTCNCLQAKVKLPSVLADNMVLQQKTDAALWGTAEPGRKVSVKTSWNKKKTVTTADPETGKWLVRVATPEAGGPYEISISDGDRLTLRNILIGEVWFASGQSNMEMPVSGYGSQPAKDGVKYILGAKASRPIRICNVKRQSSASVKDSCACTWEEHTPGAVAATSAAAYFFADALQNALDVPVGIIVSSWGGSSIETWIKREVFEQQFPSVDLSHLDGKKEITSRRRYQAPCLLYNGQVAPLVPFTFKGMLWYQGEHNRPHPERYAGYQKAYAEMMRKDFGVPDAPFYFVQIAPYPYDNARKTHQGYFYEAQAASLKIIPHSGMATTCDVGEYGTIHPSRKQEVGQRLAMLALSHDYGMDAIEADAPSYKDYEIRDGKVYVHFNAGKKGLSPMGAELSGFEIAGADHRFVPAKAMRDSKRGDTVVVSSESVPEPVAVRYCFRNWSVGNLYNNYGVPAAPFRTDDWPLDKADWE